MVGFQVVLDAVPDLEVTCADVVDLLLDFLF